MAVLYSGLGGPAGYGEDVFSTSTKSLGNNDDGSVAVDVTSVFANGFTFFGMTYTDIHINSNGAITFGLASTAYNTDGPEDFFFPALLPFYSDINLNSGGEIYWDIDPVNGNVTITWDGVAPYSGTGNNSFQVVLSDAGGGELDVEFVYSDMQWGDSGGVAAYAGLTDGGSNTLELASSGNSVAMQSYESADFNNGDPAGTFSFGTNDGFPDVLIVEGSSGDDILGLGSVDAAGNVITAGADVIDGGAGNDVLDGGAGDDVILGGSGNDTITTGSSASIHWIAYGSGADANGTTEQDFFQYTGGSGSNGTIRLNNSPEAGNADDVADYIHVTSVEDNVSLMVGDFASGTDKIVLSDGFTVSSVTFNGTFANITVTLDNGNQQFFTIYYDGFFDSSQVFTTTLPTAGSDNDTLYGGDDADTFELEDDFGVDVIFGGEGGTDSDVIDAGNMASGISVSFNANETGEISVGGDTLGFSEIERFELSDQADTLDGTNSVSSITADGAGGNDQLSGGAGDDSLTGGSGNDVLVGDSAGAFEVAALRLGTDFTVTAGDLDGGGFGTTLSVASTSSATFFTATSEIRGDDPNETFSHSDQIVVIDGVSYNVLFDDLIAYTDDVTGDTYTFAVFDVDLNSDGSAGTGEDGYFLIQTAGPEVPNGANLSFASLVDNDPDPFNLAGFETGGDDSLIGGLGDDTLIGGSGADTLAGGEGDDLIDGGAGDDFLTTGLGQDTLFGGTGDDTLMNSDGDDSLDGGAGDDSIVATGGEDTLRGGTGADTMEGGADADTFLIEDNFGNDSITGGETTTDPTDVDFDTIDLSAVTGPVTVDFSGFEAGTITDGTDTISFNEIERIITTDSNDSIDAVDDTAGVFLDAGAGQDTIKGGQGDDTILAGADDDEISDGEGNDSVDAGSGNDTIGGWLGDDTFDGGSGDDAIEGGDGSDSILGGSGSDFLVGYDAAGLTSGSTAVASDDGSSDTIEGGSGADTLSGGRGADSLSGGDDADTFIIQDDFGNDTIVGGEGVSSGSDDDLIDLSQVSTAVTVSYSDDEIGTIENGGDTISFSQTERLVLTGQDDTLDASSDSVGVNVEAGAGADTLVGGSGDDTLSGGLGDDLITGGDGDDRFEYEVGDGSDTITDFNFGNSGALGDGDTSNNDFIDLSSFYSNLSELRGDFDDDGILNQSNSANYSDNDEFEGSDGLTFQNANRKSFQADNTGVVCFAHDTMILTAKGERPAGRLRPGELIVTRDNGVQPLVMLACRKLGLQDLSNAPRLKPILIPKGLAGQTAPLTLSPQHGVLIHEHGQERLIRAKHLAQTAGFPARVKHGCRQVIYVHLIFEAHQIVYANGVASESFYPGPMALSALAPHVRTELLELFPDLPRDAHKKETRPPWEVARPYLKRKELETFEPQRHIIF